MSNQPEEQELTQEELTARKEEMKKMKPQKIDLGAVYNHRYN